MWWAIGDQGLCRSFFFSSRRRHTRCGRDWSSDVCSSDLQRAALVWGADKSAKRYCLRPAFWTSYPALVKSWNADRKSTRLNSSHVRISYAVFCLKKKKKHKPNKITTCENRTWRTNVVSKT